MYNENSFIDVRPAPRPPAGQPRAQLSVNSSPQLHQNHASMSTINSPSAYGSSTNLIQVNSSGGSPVSANGDRLIRKGWASIKEDGIKSLIWQKKFMILREISLDFHKGETSTAVSLSVPLKDIMSVNRVELKPYCIEIVRAVNSQASGMAAADAPKRTLYISVKSDPELYAWMDDVYSRCPSMGGVSNPTNFTHKVHVGFDPVSGGFTGLPEEWSKLLNSSAITKEDYQKNPQAVIEVLEFYTEGQQRLQNPNAYPGMAPTPPPVQQRVPQSPSPLPSQPNRQTTQERDAWEQQERERIASREAEYERRQREMRERDEMEKRQRELQRQEEQRMRERKEREEEELFRQQQEEELPQKMGGAQQPLMMGGGGGGGFSSGSAKNPMAKSTTTRVPQKAPSTRDMDPRRAAPKAPGPQSPKAQQTTLRAPQGPPQAKSRDPSPAPRKESPHTRTPATANAKPAPAVTAGTAVKPLNVPNKTPAKEVQARERKDTKRISNMTEAQVMEKLRSVVSPGDPNQSYTKIKKVGQGASGSVYVAKVNSSPSSSTALAMLSAGKNTSRVAIKQMDLAHQPRKELIVNEILVMKESQHPNIVNFLDAFLKGSTELWVVMEYMEGGALTDVIDNNTLEEDQIATICLEVRPQIQPQRFTN